MAVGVVHPGEMGAAIGRELVARGATVRWASEGRSKASATRASVAGLVDANDVAGLAGGCDTILSVCPPHAAVDVARAVASAGFRGWYVDANAVSPSTAREVAAVVTAAGARFVDGGIIGSPPAPGRPVHLWLSGPGAAEVAGSFEGTEVLARVVGTGEVAASALKMCFAAWTKGASALLLATRSVARRHRVEEELLGEWAALAPGLVDQSRRAAQQAATKGWRWVKEMEEIAVTFAEAGLPAGFHEAARAVYAAVELDRTAAPDEATAEAVLSALMAMGPAG